MAEQKSVAVETVKKAKKRTIQYDRWGYFFIAPFFLVYIIFSLIPLATTFVYSFFEYYRDGLEIIGPNAKVAKYYYYRNDEDEVKIEAEDELEIIEEIDIREGINKITIVAVDTNNNMTEEEQEIKGLSKPKIDAWKEEAQLILKITHEQGIRKIKVKYNGEELEYGSDVTKNEKNITLRFNLKQGDNHVDVWAYGIEDTEEVAPGEFLNGVATYNP